MIPLVLLLAFAVAMLLVVVIVLWLSFWALQDKVEAIREQASQALKSADCFNSDAKTLSTRVEQLAEGWRDVDHRTKWSGKDGTTTEQALGRLKGVESDLGAVRKDLVVARDKFEKIDLRLMHHDYFVGEAERRLNAVEADLATLTEDPDAQA
jgi:hypothetical protein